MWLCVNIDAGTGGGGGGGGGGPLADMCVKGVGWYY